GLVQFRFDEQRSAVIGLRGLVADGDLEGVADLALEAEGGDDPLARALGHQGKAPFGGRAVAAGAEGEVALALGGEDVEIPAEVGEVRIAQGLALIAQGEGEALPLAHPCAVHGGGQFACQRGAGEEGQQQANGQAAQALAGWGVAEGGGYHRSSWVLSGGRLRLWRCSRAFWRA